MIEEERTCRLGNPLNGLSNVHTTSIIHPQTSSAVSGRLVGGLLTSVCQNKNVVAHSNTAKFIGINSLRRGINCDLRFARRMRHPNAHNRYTNQSKYGMTNTSTYGICASRVVDKSSAGVPLGGLFESSYTSVHTNAFITKIAVYGNMSLSRKLFV